MTTYYISKLPEYYGSDVTEAQAESIAIELAAAIEKEFEGVTVNIVRQVAERDDQASHVIGQWVNDNWADIAGYVLEGLEAETVKLDCGFTVYHKYNSGQPSAHDGGPWFYEPTYDYDGGEVYSEGYNTKADAVAAAEAWTAQQESEREAVEA